MNEIEQSETRPEPKPEDFGIDTGETAVSYLLGREAALYIEMKRDYHAPNQVEINELDLLNAAKNRPSYFYTQYIGPAIALYAKKIREKKFWNQEFAKQLDDIVKLLPSRLPERLTTTDHGIVTLAFHKQRSFDAAYRDWRFSQRKKKKEEEPSEAPNAA